MSVASEHLSLKSREYTRVPRWLTRWNVSALLIALFMALPVLTVISFIFHPSGDIWAHLVDTVLANYVKNSFLLVLGVSIGTLCIGVTAAWLCSMCRFPGRRIFEWTLLLPLAFPAYITAYTYTGMLDFTGPLQTLLRDWFGWSYGDYWFPEIRSLTGAVIMLSLVLYPYVYLLARAAFLEQSICALDASRTLGATAWQSFRRVALPMARPAIITGLSLALMETLADYGTVKYFGVDTFTTGIFRTWFGLGDSAAAAQLAALLMSFVFALILMERYSRRRARFHNATQRYQPLPHYELRGAIKLLAVIACFLPVFLGFVLPAMQLSFWAYDTASETMNADFFRLILNTLLLATITALVALAVALFMAYGKRLSNTPLIRFAVNLSGMGYAIPGTVIAVGVLLPFAWFDNTLDSLLRNSLGISSGLLLSGTLVALIFAYVVRFLAVSLQTVDASLGKIRTTMDDAARCMGYSAGSVMTRIHMPIMRGSLLAALLLVFVDVMKELPATLILRPFNFNTLAIRTFELASDERLAESSTAALTIVLTGILPVILLSRTITHSRPGHDAKA